MQCDTTYGAWYNYTAATAGTITGDPSSSSFTTTATYDICPASWKLPNVTEINNMLPYISNFDLVIGGDYVNGRIANENSGHWWSASPSINTSYTTTHRAQLLYDRDTSRSDAGSYYRYRGVYIRCINSGS